ncbi:hypothetical protein GCM10022422_18500 [Flavobacterium ginsengisoli]|uniref:DUF11 domain-containing protein n=1 Tax=Flavobacterium ginsengisoli TaxID=871694 RepID=A0ABP7FER3_9FLAO
MKKYIKQIAAFAFIATLASCSADDNMEFATTGGNAVPTTTSISRLDNNYNLPLNTYTKEGVTVTKVEIFKNAAKTPPTDPIVFGDKVADATLSEGKATFNTSTLGSFDNFPVTEGGVTTLTGKTGTFELAILATYSDGTTSRAPFSLVVGKAITWQVVNADGDLVNSTSSGISAIKFNDPAAYEVHIAPLTKAATTITSIVGQWSKNDTGTFTNLPGTLPATKQTIDLNSYPYSTYGGIVAGDKITYKFIITSGTQTDEITTTVTFADQVFGASHNGNISDSESTFSFKTGDHEASEIDFVSPFGFATSEGVSIDFVKDNTVNYSTANLFAAENAYNAGTKVTSLTNLVVGDVIVYKITRSVNFGTESDPDFQDVLYTGIIKITDKVQGTTSQELKFSYKEGVLAD